MTNDSVLTLMQTQLKVVEKELQILKDMIEEELSNSNSNKTISNDDLVKDILDRLRKIEEYDKGKGAPKPFNPYDYYPPLAPFQPSQPFWLDNVRYGPATCQKCGIDQSGVTGYVCGRVDCPTSITNYTITGPKPYKYSSLDCVGSTTGKVSEEILKNNIFSLT